MTGTPLIPAGNPGAGTPFPDPNPPVTDTDTAQVDVVDPALTLTKTVDKSVVFPGTTVKYAYEATNRGNADLRNDTGNAGWVTDDKCSPVTQVATGGFNDGDANQDTLLNPGETWQFECTATINTRTLNTAEIQAQPVDPDGDPVGDPLVRQAVALVQIVDPAIDLVKVATVPVVLDPDANPVAGPDTPTPHPAQYVYQAANTGDVPLQDIVFTDDKCDGPVRDDAGDIGGDDVMDPGEVWDYTCETTLEREDAENPPVIGAESGLVTNTATVRGTPYLPDEPETTGPPVSATDTAQVLVIEPGLELTKSASETIVEAGTEVDYTVTVRNTGDVGLDIVGPLDDKCGFLDFVDGDDNGNQLLDGVDSGGAETWTYTCTRAIGLPAAPDTTDTNAAAVIGIDPLGNLYEATDTAEVGVLAPAINLTKTVDAVLVPVGTDVGYTLEVTNAGQSPLPQNDVLAQITLVDVADPATPTCDTPTLVSKTGGDQDEFLERTPAETWIYACTATITDRTVNVAVVGGLGGTTVEGFDGEIPVFDVAAAGVDVFHPAIDVEKAAEPTELIGGGDVTYTYEVRNTGDVPLSGVADRITDDTCSPVTYVSGDQDGDNLLDTPTSIFEDALDETWIFTCTMVIGEDTTNVVTTTGTPTDSGGIPLCPAREQPQGEAAAQRVPGDPCDVTDTDTAVVDVIDPGSITVVKQAEPDTSAEFGFTMGGVSFTLTDGASRTFDALAPGSYDIAEIPFDGWDLTSIVCDDPSGDSTVALSAGVASAQLAEGEDVTCVFTNIAQARPTPTSAPTVPPQPGGGSLPSTGLGLSWHVPALGLGLILLGGWALMASRRRTMRRS